MTSRPKTTGRLSFYEHPKGCAPAANTRFLGIWPKVSLAYQMLTQAVASFGGGPNVNSRATVTRGVDLLMGVKGMEGQK